LASASLRDDHVRPDVGDLPFPHLETLLGYPCANVALADGAVNNGYRAQVLVALRPVGCLSSEDVAEGGALAAFLAAR
jgi:hypothetical protein